MKINDLLEARRNKDHPAQQLDRVPGDGKKSIEELLKPFLGKDLFVSFTNLDKLGVNTNTPTGYTPVGIYAFPLVDDHSLDNFHGFQYRNYMFILKNKTSLLNVENYSFLDLLKDVTKLKKIYPTHEAIPSLKKIKPLSSKLLSNEKLSYDEIEIFQDTFKNWDDNEQTLPFKMLYDLTSNIANGNELLWTKILHSLGINGISDYGNGVIYLEEPTQVVFFRREYFSIVDRYKIGGNIENTDNDIKQRKLHKENDSYMKLSDAKKLQFLSNKINWFSINFYDTRIIGQSSLLVDIIKRTPNNVINDFTNKVLSMKKFNNSRKRIILFLVSLNSQLLTEFKDNDTFMEIIKNNKMRFFI